MNKREQVARVVRSFLVPMVRSLPHRLAARVRESERRRNAEQLAALRPPDPKTDRFGRPLIARKSLGFRTLTDIPRPA